MSLPIEVSNEKYLDQLMLSSTTQQILFKILKIKFCTKKKHFLQVCNDSGPMDKISGNRNSFTSRATICLMNFLKILDNWTKKTILSLKRKKYFYDRALACHA